jgi:hypothetical protein
MWFVFCEHGQFTKYGKTAHLRKAEHFGYWQQASGLVVMEADDLEGTDIYDQF